MNVPQAGQTVYAILFRWPDGSTSWAGVLDGRPGFTPSVDADRTQVFVDGNSAYAFLGAYSAAVRGYGTVTPCMLSELSEDE